MTQIVKFPDAVWGRLASLAETREVSIADLIVETAEHLLPAAGSRRRGRRVLDGEDPAIAARIRDLVETHHTTAGIARELGVSVDSVRTVLRHLGMPTDNRHHAARTRTQER